MITKNNNINNILIYNRFIVYIKTRIIKETRSTKNKFMQLNTTIFKCIIIQILLF